MFQREGICYHTGYKPLFKKPRPDAYQRMERYLQLKDELEKGKN